MLDRTIYIAFPSRHLRYIHYQPRLHNLFGTIPPSQCCTVLGHQLPARSTISHTSLERNPEGLFSIGWSPSDFVRAGRERCSHRSGEAHHLYYTNLYRSSWQCRKISEYYFIRALSARIAQITTCSICVRVVTLFRSKFVVPLSDLNT